MRWVRLRRLRRHGRVEVVLCTTGGQWRTSKWCIYSSVHFMVGLCPHLRFYSSQALTNDLGSWSKGTVTVDDKAGFKSQLYHLLVWELVQM